MGCAYQLALKSAAMWQAADMRRRQDPKEKCVPKRGRSSELGGSQIQRFSQHGRLRGWCKTFTRRIGETDREFHIVSRPTTYTPPLNLREEGPSVVTSYTQIEHQKVHGAIKATGSPLSVHVDGYRRIKRQFGRPQASGAIQSPPPSTI